MLKTLAYVASNLNLDSRSQPIEYTIARCDVSRW